MKQVVPCTYHRLFHVHETDGFPYMKQVVSCTENNVFHLHETLNDLRHRCLQCAALQVQLSVVFQFKVAGDGVMIRASHLAVHFCAVAFPVTAAQDVVEPEVHACLMIGYARAYSRRRVGIIQYVGEPVVGIRYG